MLTKNVIKRLDKKGIPINFNMPGISSISIRDAKEVAIRANILGVLLAISDDTSSKHFFKDLLTQQGLFYKLSEDEKLLLEKQDFTEQEEINLS